MKNWRRHFCLLPRYVNGRFLWLQYAERRLIFSYLDDYYEWRLVGVRP
jgi:hypothetical protein